MANPADNIRAGRVDNHATTRRLFLGALGAATTGLTSVTSAFAQSSGPDAHPQPHVAGYRLDAAQGTVRDRLWLWGHVEGSHNGHWGLKKKSRMTMMEACAYMHLPNLVVVEYNKQPAPEMFEQHMLALSGLKRVCWSVIGAAGPNNIITDHLTPVKNTLALAQKFPNLTDVMLDDYFVVLDDQKRRCRGRVTTEQLQEMRQMLRAAAKPHDMWAVVYDFHVDLVPQDHLDLLDVVNFWTWRAGDLKFMEDNLKKLKARVPNKRIVLGCYMYDYGNHKEMPVEAMQMQCETGLKWLEQGEIEGIIFLASCICDLNLPAVEWTRRWIAQVGDKTI